MNLSYHRWQPCYRSVFSLSELVSLLASHVRMPRTRTVIFSWRINRKEGRIITRMKQYFRFSSWVTCVFSLTVISYTEAKVWTLPTAGFCFTAPANSAHTSMTFYDCITGEARKRTFFFAACLEVCCAPLYLSESKSRDALRSNKRNWTMMIQCWTILHCGKKKNRSLSRV